MAERGVAQTEQTDRTLDALLPGARALTHAYLLIAEPEAGYTAARALARSMLCSSPEGRGRPCGRCRDCRKAEKGIHPDIMTVSRQVDDKGKQKREIYVDQIRALAADAVVLPNEAEHKVYIIREADTMNAAAQNALLKILEEPPRFVSILLVASSGAAMLDTVRSRCLTLHINGEDDAPSPEARERAERFLTFAAAEAKISLLSFANENADLSNADMSEFVTAAQMLLTDMLCGRLPDLRMTRSRMMRLSSLLQTAEQYLRFNVSTKHVLGFLAVDAGDPESKPVDHL